MVSVAGANALAGCFPLSGGMGMADIVDAVPPDGRTLDPDLTNSPTAECLENGLVVLSCGLYGNVIQNLVPLTAADAVIDEGLDALQESLLARAERTAA